ncbi:MAG: preprotein translocase subunit SecG [Gammaproteobacteria bacterium]
MYQVVIIFHVLLGISIIGLVMMQQGKGADAGAAFGSGASGTVFGAQGAASFLSRTTAIMAALFFTTSLGLAVLSGHTERSKDLMLDDLPAAEISDVPMTSDDTGAVAVPSMSRQTTSGDVPAVTSDVVPPASDAGEITEVDAPETESP